jgi:hypothetical protein
MAGSFPEGIFGMQMSSLLRDLYSAADLSYNGQGGEM